MNEQDDDRDRRLLEVAAPEVSVVIPAFNAERTLGRQLSALAAQETSIPYEVIVVDNASSDRTAQLVESVEGVRLLCEPTPGANRARNTGVGAARGSAILLTDADDEVGGGWIDALLRGLEHADYVGGVLETTALNDDNCRRKWGVPEPIWALESTKPYSAPIGTNCGFRRQLWEELSGFDEELRGANDEYEFFWRAGARGFSYGRCPDAIVHYRLRPGTREILRHLYRQGRADVRTYRRSKHLGYEPDPLAHVAKVYARIAVDLIVGARDSRRRWAGGRLAARRLGRLAECLISRTWFP